jgi:hypothetical protein
MPRLSLYKPEKSQDYKFFDRTVYEMFQVGGVDVFVHKYTGTDDGAVVKDHTQIQDLLFLENRDRRYSDDIYTLRGHYQVADIDFNLSQFGLFLSNDTIFMTIHINNSVDLLGRKIMAGDVIELPNLKDEHAMNDYATALKRFYVVEEVNRAAEGFSATWYPHLYRVKLKSIVDSQEYKDLLDRPTESDNYAGEWSANMNYYPGQVVKYRGTLYEVTQEIVGNIPGLTDTTVEPTVTDAWQDYFTVSTTDTLRDLMSTYEKELAINNAVVAEAEADAKRSGYDTSHYYTVKVDENTGTVDLTLVTSDMNVSVDTNITGSELPLKEGYTGYLMGDGIAPNGPIVDTADITIPEGQVNAQFGFGIQFPSGATSGDVFLRTDFMPNRMFRFDGRRWIKQEDNVRMTMSNSDDTRQTQRTGFVNNTEKSGINQLANDVIYIDLLGDPIWESGSITQDLQITTTSVFILTNVPYNKNYLVEVWIDENSKATKITTSEVSGSLAVTIGHPVQDNSVIRYSVYDKVVAQRQSLSKALRPQADN